MVAGPRERRFSPDASRGPDSRGLFWFGLVIGTFFFLAAISAWQVSRPTQALQILEPAIASTTDIDRLLAAELPALKEQAQTTDQAAYELPGYPLRVEITRDELRTASEGTLRATILARSSTLVYRDGLSAFTHEREQSISRFSLQGVMRTIEGQLGESANTRAKWATIALAIFVGGMALGVMMTGEGLFRFRSLGSGVLAGALPGLVISAVVVFWIGRNESDPYLNDLRDVLVAVFTVFLRNYLVVTVFAAVVAASGPLLAKIERRMFADALAAQEREEANALVAGPPQQR
ncbi:hypothetical protein AYO38_07350 [bacterium SCGC AG-212-C10]|nr:hypothetical protein AYO38_07350 [bacterium SCGC AG-212-C10]